MKNEATIVHFRVYASLCKCPWFTGGGVGCDAADVILLAEFYTFTSFDTAQYCMLIREASTLYVVFIICLDRE